MVQWEMRSGEEETDGKCKRNEWERSWRDIEIETEKAPSTPSIGDFPPFFGGILPFLWIKIIFFQSKIFCIIWASFGDDTAQGRGKGERPRDGEDCPRRIVTQ